MTAADRRGPALDALLRRVLRWRAGGGVRWLVERRPARAPTVCSADGEVSASVSLSHVRGRVVVAVADRRCGVDAETRGRVADAAGPSDRWLSAAERHACTVAPDVPAALACRWVLKEALGKALGTGLPPQPERWSFALHDQVEGRGVPAGFRFGLFAADDLLIGVVLATA